VREPQCVWGVSLCRGITESRSPGAANGCGVTPSINHRPVHQAGGPVRQVAGSLVVTRPPLTTVPPVGRRLRPGCRLWPRSGCLPLRASRGSDNRLGHHAGDDPPGRAGPVQSRPHEHDLAGSGRPTRCRSRTPLFRSSSPGTRSTTSSSPRPCWPRWSGCAGRAAAS